VLPRPGWAAYASRVEKYGSSDMARQAFREFVELSTFQL
jgi:hypothetical protein